MPAKKVKFWVDFSGFFGHCFLGGSFNPSLMSIKRNTMLEFSYLRIAGRIITNIRPTKSLRLILGLIFEINLAEIKLQD